VAGDARPAGLLRCLLDSVANIGLANFPELPASVMRGVTLAGIAGESDLDAPDLNAPGTPEPRLTQRPFSSFNLPF
jgi:hypothetical protein